MGMVTMSNGEHFSGCGTATAHFPYSDSVKEGHMVYFKRGGHMTIIVMQDDAPDDCLTDHGRGNVIRTIKEFIGRQ